MVKSPKISIVIPFYNRFKWLEQAIKSVLDQKYQDFEIILIDDGSTSDINNYINLKHTKIRYYRQNNKGPASARNLGVEKSRGKYIAFLDSDDLFLPNKLAIQIAVMEENPNVILSHTSYQYFGSSTIYQSTSHSGKLSGRVYPDIIFNCLIATPTVMLRKKKLGQLRFEEKLKVGEDVVLWIRIAQRSEIIGIDKVLTRVRQHRLHTALNNDLNLPGFLKITDIAILDARKNPFQMMNIISTKNYLLKDYFTHDKKKYRKYQIKAVMTNPFNILIWRDLCRFVQDIVILIFSFVKKRLK